MLLSYSALFIQQIRIRCLLCAARVLEIRWPVHPPGACPDSAFVFEEDTDNGVHIRERVRYLRFL